MKVSDYNFSFLLTEDTNDKKRILYNCMTNSLALIEEDKYFMLENFVSTGKEIEDLNLIEDLKKGGFLIEEDFNELAEIKYRLLNGRFSSNSLGLTLAPTSDCNFRCVYCYEKDVIKPLYMSEAI